jgi:hypothetical protein
MNKPNLKSPECEDAMEKVRQICSDTRYYEDYKLSVAHIVRSAFKNEYLSQKQIDYIGKYWTDYQRIKKFNEGFEQGFPDYAISLFENAIEFARPHVKGNKSLKSQRGSVYRRLNQIKKGQYFWNLHVMPIKGLLKGLERIGVKNENLEKSVDDLFKKLSIPGYEY